jgi:DNA processing protein
VEAPAKSGALITAQFALEQGRDLWVASSGAAGNAGGAFQAYGEGTRGLAADGAKIIYSGSDILDEWGIQSTQILNSKEKNVWP